DRSFITDIPNTVDDMTLVRTILSLGHSLGLRVAAEGIETVGQYDFLVEEGCDEAQGFLLAKPISSDAFLKLLRADTEGSLSESGHSMAGR
ncbi:MAG: EAL domain-containing protein, partial [Pseudomonadota bacterium]